MAATLIPGVFVAFDWRDRPVRFFVRDLVDMTQSVHTNGAFFEERELEIIERHLAPDSVVLEVGAGVGNHAVFLASFCAPRSLILIEPDRTRAGTLRVNLLLNRIEPELSHLGLHLSDGAAAVPPGRTAATGDSVFADRKIDFIHIDQPGRELEVLGGLERTIAASRPAIFVRIDNANRRRFGTWVTAHGYEVAESLRRFPENENFMIRPRAAAV